MMKFVFVTFILFIFFFLKNLALDAENYTAYIKELNHNEKFLEEYTKWSFELFSQPDYLYGKPHAHFPCPIEKSSNNDSIPTSVHTLRLSDIKCIGAIGDSFIAGLGAHAITPIGLLFENRGISWSIGGDYTYSKIISIPNALRQYNPKLKGFSTEVSIMFPNDQNATNNQLNVAKSGDRSIHMPYQAELLINRLKDDHLCDWNNDWKMITFFVGGNDLCSFCEDSNITNYTPENYMIYVRDTLDKLYNAPLPRTFVNLVLGFDVRSVKDLKSGGYICHMLHKKTCPCAAFPTNEQTKILDDYIPRYYQILVDLVDSGRYEGRDDFTVVIQPFMAKTKLPYKDNHKIDFSYFAPDCFHFSGKGHSQAALSLWNNMLEPVGSKQWSWNMEESLKCPTKKYPFIFTSKNSAEALNELKHTTIVQTTNRTSTIISDTSTFDMDSTIQHHHKDRKSKSNSSSTKMKFIALTSFLFFIIVLLLVCIVRRRKTRLFIPKIQRNRFDGMDNSHYPEDNDEVEIWSRPTIKPDYFENNETTKTHGTRISLD